MICKCDVWKHEKCFKKWLYDINGEVTFIDQEAPLPCANDKSVIVLLRHSQAVLLESIPVEYRHEAAKFMEDSRKHIPECTISVGFHEWLSKKKHVADCLFE